MTENVSVLDAASCGPGCGCVPLPRRNFLALSGLTLVSAALGTRAAFADSYAPTDFERLIPPIKNLKPEWLRSLFARGEPAVYTKKRDELKFIGMPVGGICCGTLYLGGDGKLWVWDIFNQNKNGILGRNVPWDGFGQPRSISSQDGGAYVQPHTEESPLQQGFAVRVGGVVRTLDAAGWEDVTFAGTYPIGTVEYSDPACPVTVTLRAYSPFIPGNADDSGIPATLCEFTLHNTGKEAITTDIGSWLENATSLYSAQPGASTRVNEVRTAPDQVVLNCRFSAVNAAPLPVSTRPDVLVNDFSGTDYGTWKTEGTAFGSGPRLRTELPAYQGDLGGVGDRLVNTHGGAPGTTVEERDRNTGTLTSPEFTIERRFLAFDIGGGANIDQVGLRLIVDGKTVRRAAGRDNNRMHAAAIDVSEYAGNKAIIEIYDHGTGPWGNVGVDRIVQTDTAVHVEGPQPTDRDFGTMALGLLESGIGLASVAPTALFTTAATNHGAHPVGEPAIGGITKAVHLNAGESRTVRFVVAWNFPNSGLPVTDAGSGNHYATRFADAAAVVAYVAKNYERLSADTKLWRDTWYDSTLPHWFLDRTFANTSILATSTAHRFGTGRFWGWEGIGCCEGTCTHVWHYAQAPGRIFPELERHTREFTDFGVALDSNTGMIGYRGEHTGPAVDGQCGRILGVYREHQMSGDNTFLHRIWPRVREGMTFLLRHDSNEDGLLDGAQENTLDAAWFGKIAWISSLYAAALRACEVMATEVGDADFASLCKGRFARTKAAIENELFNGEYFIQKPEPGKEGALGTYGTCHIDQVHGQSWAWQIGLGRVLDREKTLSALRALYKYNFTPDIGPFRRANTPGRAYALEGDGGLIMTTNPASISHAFGNVKDWQYGYFNECMSGFEHQAASHMIAEGMVEEGLAVTRAIHDRYHPRLRNPYNEIECSDHYSRSMASYGSFISACGFEYHGPTGHIGFAPRITPAKFKTPFTAAKGWGTYAQTRTGNALAASIHVAHGELDLHTVALAGNYGRVTAKIGGAPVAATAARAGTGTTVTLSKPMTLRKGEKLELSLEV